VFCRVVSEAATVDDSRKARLRKRPRKLIYENDEAEEGAAAAEDAEAEEHAEAEEDADAADDGAAEEPQAKKRRLHHMNSPSLTDSPPVS
jgi:hypothetical protein